MELKNLVSHVIQRLSQVSGMQIDVHKPFSLGEEQLVLRHEQERIGQRRNHEGQ
jgi:hypothetical protein